MCLALCLGVVCFALAGNAWAAGTTRLAAGLTADTYALESTITPGTYVSGFNTIQYGNVYKLATVGSYSSDVYRDMSVLRTAGQNFYITFAMQNGALFQGVNNGTSIFGCPTGMTCRLPAAGDLTLAVAGGGAVTITKPAIGAPDTNGVHGSSFVTYLVTVTTTFTSAPTFLFSAATNGVTVRDPNTTNRLATGPIQITAQTYDATSGLAFDTGGVDTINFMAAVPAVQISQPLVPTSAVIDSASQRLRFIATAPDTISVDNGATLGIGYTTPVPLSYTGAIFALAATDKVRLTVTSTDLSGLVNIPIPPQLPGTPGTTPGITWAGVPATYAAGNSRNLDVGNASMSGAAQNFVFTVDNTTPLVVRTISVKVDVILAAYGATQGGGTKANLLPVGTVTQWTSDGEVLVAPWLNGNTNAYSSRIYLYNSSSVAGDVTARVLTMAPAGGTVTSTELTTPGSPVLLGTLSAGSSMNIRLKEDVLNFILANLPGQTLPYTTNNGNLTVEITIKTHGVSGTSQVFSNSVGYGIVPLLVVSP